MGTQSGPPMPALRAVLLAGGCGTRLWPMSREHFPKQFLPLFGERSPLQQTWLRVARLAPQAPILVTNEEHRFLAAEQLRQVSFPEDARLLLEPAARNTAPAIALAALQATTRGEDALLLVLPSDHALTDVPAFEQAVQQALPVACTGRLVTFGVVPDHPETGYGYIRAGAALATESPDVREIEAFIEKPGAEQAAVFVQDGRHYWNSGMFLFLASAYLDALGKFRPEILAACRAAMAGRQEDGDFTRPARQAFEACPAESVDYAIMEHTDEGVVLSLEAGWSDIGSWDALRRLASSDADGNVLCGDVLAQSCRNVYARTDGRLVALLGLDNVVVVDTPDALLVAASDSVQQVREVVAALRDRGRAEAVAPRRGFRPWGYFDAIDAGDRFQVKRITVRPGGRLSLQLHHHRAEHWVVVRGTARVTRGEDTFLLTENQSTYIPLGVRHRLENPGTIPLELIEVQSGAYLGEDDIVRYDDAYGR